MYKLAVPVLNWGEFLDQSMIDEARQVVRDNKDKFVPTSVSTNENGFRSSVVLWHYNYENLYAKFVARIEQMMPVIKDNMQEYALCHPHTKIELQLTNHYRNGDHFNKHVDNASIPGKQDETPNRRLSCVYYFSMYDENKFEDGELKVYLANGTVNILPFHNSIAIFPSGVYHEVCPIKSKTEDFFDGRFTLNAWVHG